MLKLKTDSFPSSLRKKGEDEKLASSGETPEGDGQQSKSSKETVQDASPGESETDNSELKVKDSYITK